jgi:hypothetical protein
LLLRGLLRVCFLDSARSCAYYVMDEGVCRLRLDLLLMTKIERCVVVDDHVVYFSCLA